MRVKLFHWLGREFVALSGEGRAELSAQNQTRDLLLRFDRELRDPQGLSLDNTVRTRLWRRDCASYDQVRGARLRPLRRGSLGQFQLHLPEPFESDASAALDLIAMRPSRSGVQKIIKEHEPPIVPVRCLVYDFIVFLSGAGVTAALPTLAGQVVGVLACIEGSLADTESSWERSARVSCYLQGAPAWSGASPVARIGRGWGRSVLNDFSETAIPRRAS